MTPFDGDDYRKRVLAAVQRRGGVAASDPFEWYDLPLTEVRDSTAVAQVEAVWAFWQKQRDSPKYRGLVTALLAEHAALAPLLATASSRRQLAERIARERADRDDGRWAELDAAAERLVSRFGGVPSSKLAGLRALGAAAGMPEADVDARLARHPVLQVQTAAAATVPPAVARQLRADLDELGRLVGSPPPVTLYALLGLPPGADPREVAAEREAASARNRELRPDRRRALVDDLLTAVTTLLVEADGSAYLDAVADDVAAALRPRAAAAVLVEDLLSPSDAAVLVEQAEALGLDRGRAVRVVQGLAAELGVAFPDVGAALPRPSAPVAAGPDLAPVRAALAAGRAVEAERLVVLALRRDASAPARALAAEVEAVLAEARSRWRAVEAALAARRFAEALDGLDRLAATANDLPSPAGVPVEQVRASAWDALAAAERAADPADERALLAAWEQAPDAPAVLAALQALGVQPPADVRAERTGGGVLVRWRPSASAGPVDYRLLRLRPDGGRAPVGWTSGTSLEDGGVRPGDPLPAYAVVARRAGVLSQEALSGAAPAAAPPAPAAAASPLPPVPALAAALTKRGLGLTWAPPASGRAEVRRLPDGVRPPEPGSVVDAEALGPVVPVVGPGLAVGPRPDAAPVVYVVLTRDEAGAAVAGASVAVAALPAPIDLRVEDGRLRWTWPPGCTEALVLVRPDAEPAGPGDPAATARKTTLARYELDGGAPLPGGSGHVAVLACTRAGAVLVAGVTPARLAL